MITNPFENRKKKEPVDIRKIFGLGSPLSTPTARAKMSTSSSVQEREPLTGLSGKSFSVRDLLSGLEEKKSTFPIPEHMVGSTVDRQSSYKNNINTDVLGKIGALESKTGVPFGGAKNTGPLGLTTPGILEGLVKNDEMPYDNQPRVLFPDEVNSVAQQQQQQQQQQQATPIQQTQQTAAVDPEQRRTERINQLINLGKTMGGNPDIDEMIMTAILNEYMAEPEDRTDQLAQAYQLTQDPLIGQEFATGLYGELGIDPVEKQKQDLYMQEFMKDFTENADTADIYAAVRRNPNLVEQYYNALDREGKGFLGLNNTEKKREERMRRLMGTGSTVTQ